MSVRIRKDKARKQAAPSARKLDRRLPLSDSDHCQLLRRLLPSGEAALKLVHQGTLHCLPGWDQLTSETTAQDAQSPTKLSQPAGKIAVGSTRRKVAGLGALCLMFAELYLLSFRVCSAPSARGR
jgi:hypothetical protein